MAQDGQNVEMQDKPDGCLSTVDEEEREPCLKKTDEAANNADGKNNGTVPAAAAAAAAAANPPTADGRPSADNNNSSSKNGKFRALAAATSLERKFRDQTGYSRTGLLVAAATALLCLVLFVVLVVLLFKWPRPPRPLHVCRSASCLRASAEVSFRARRPTTNPSGRRLPGRARVEIENRPARTLMNRPARAIVAYYYF